MTAWQVVEAEWTSKAQNLEHYIACQERYSLLEREYEPNMAAMVEAYGLGLIPFSPLANGLLTGKYRRNQTLPAGARLTTTQRMADRYLTERNWAIVEKLADFCASRGRSMLELAMSWLASRPACQQRHRRRHPARSARSRMSAPSNGRCHSEDMDEIDRLTAN